MEKGKNKKKKKLRIARIALLVIILAIIAIVIKLIFFNKKPKDLGTEVVSKNTVEHQDNEHPTIELKGKEKNILAVGRKYIEEGAIATDNIDGDISSKIITKGTVDTSKVGNYEITYEVQDEKGNKAETKRTVKVVSPLGNKGLPVLMYHFFYDKNVSKGTDDNWVEISKFEEQIKYLAENDFYLPTWEEVEEYIDGKIELPEKSVVITVDDGDDSFFELAVPVLQKYNIDATSFIITAWYGGRANDKQKNVSYQSHSEDMHKGGANGKGVALSWSYEDIVKDVKQSKAVLGGDATVFCYPFGHYGDTVIKALKDTGYKLAFTTEAGRVYKGNNKYALPRVRVMGRNSYAEFKNMIK